MFCKSKMSREDRQKWKLRMYNYWEDTLEERLAGVRACKAKLEEQIQRDSQREATDRLHDDMRNKE